MQKNPIAEGGGGHVIENASGTELNQRSIMQFVDGLKATDDAVNDATLVSDAPDEYTWAQWNNLTTAQQEAIPHALITDAPDVDAGVNADLLTKLWENLSPTSNFGTQDIELSSTDYDFLMFIFKIDTSRTYTKSVIIPKGGTAHLDFGYYTSADNQVIYYRTISSTDDDTLHVSGASKAKNTSESADNSICIPIAIYGIKKTLNLQFTAIASDVSTSADKCMLSDGVTSVEDALYKVLKTSSSNVTYAVQLGELYSVFNTLSDSDKMKCVIKRGDSIYSVNDIASGKFGLLSYASANLQYLECNLASATYKQVVATANSLTVNDLSSNTDTVPLYLVRA